ncbi:MAG: hypothetical protein AB8G23_16785 [Myxococcota bacterium]
MDLGYSALTRRERLERIATAERDRRAGRIDMAVATLGEPTEWPARAVLALARLPESEGEATRKILESGLDVWAEELSLDPLSAEATSSPSDDLSFDALEVPTLADVQDELDRPLEAFELDEAFAQAETQVEEMLDVNDVAERVLQDEPLGLAELSEEGSLEILGEPLEHFDVDAAEVPRAAFASNPQSNSDEVILATLEGWLHNLESDTRRSAR